jgi:hypothetical protein
MSHSIRRSAFRLAALATVLTAVFVAVASPASAAGFSQMQLKERPWGGLVCLEIDNGLYPEGSPASVEWCSQKTQHSQWQTLATTDGYVQLRVAHTSQCLTVRSGSYADNAQVEQQPCNGYTNQQWKFVPSYPGSPYNEVIARHSLKCLDRTWTSNVVQYNCHGGDNQLWSQPVPA